MRLTSFLITAALVICGTLSSPMVHAQTAAGQACKLAISGNDAIQYNKKEMKASSKCPEIEVTLTHTGKLPVQAMGHNWVLTRKADLDAVVAAGLKAGPQNHYVPPADKRVIAATRLVGGGQSTSVSFKPAALKPGETYVYVCTFPGHAALMQGTFTIS